MVLDEQHISEAGSVALYCLSILLIVLALGLLSAREGRGPISVPDRPIRWGWYDSCSARARSRIAAISGTVSGVQAGRASEESELLKS